MQRQSDMGVLTYYYILAQSRECVSSIKPRQNSLNYFTKVFLLHHYFSHRSIQEGSSRDFYKNFTCQSQRAIP